MLGLGGIFVDYGPNDLLKSKNTKSLRDLLANAISGADSVGLAMDKNVCCKYHTKQMTHLVLYIG